MNRRAFLSVVSGSLLAAPLAADAQQAGKVPLVGLLCWDTCSANRHEGLWQGLRQLGYRHYKNTTFEIRVAGGDRTVLDVLAAELVRLKPDIIVADSTQAALAVKKATGTIPLVVIADDPVGSGLVRNLARPGENVTGLSSLAPEVGAKQLELLREAVPKVSQVAVLWNPANSATALRLRAAQAVARSLGVTLLSVEVHSPADYESAFSTMARLRANALIDAINEVELGTPGGRVVALARTHRLPAIYQSEEFVVAGGLMSYGASLRDQFRQAAALADRILKGARPADLPIEQPTKFQLVINLKTAKALGLTIPPSLLQRADQVIE
jgi:putative tryptophan/tyrosine transport system substrate-binding protein